MFIMRRTFLITLGLVIAMAFAACGNSSSGSGSSGRYGSGGSTNPTPVATSSGSGSSNTIKTATATVKGKSVTILTNAQGMTLYYRTSDTSSSVCSGQCASFWPPYLVTGSSAPGSSTTLPGTLAVAKNANGNQVTYNGHPLYTYSGDSAPGQTNGESVGGVWFVVPTNLSSQGGGYGYNY